MVVINGNATKTAITPDSGDENKVTSNAKKIIAKNIRSGSTKIDKKPNSIEKITGTLKPLFTSRCAASASPVMGNPRQSNRIHRKNWLSYIAFARLLLENSIKNPPTIQILPTIISLIKSSPAYSEYVLTNCMMIR